MDIPSTSRSDAADVHKPPTASGSVPMTAKGESSSTSKPPESRDISGSDNYGFNKWRRRFAEITGAGMSADEWANTLARQQRLTCEKWRNELVNHSPAVTFMLKHIKETGVDKAPEDRIFCLPCDITHAGGFSPDAGAVVLCQGKFWSKKHMEHTLTHELVHMYDQSKFNVDWSNLRHHACSEIRANSLGGDCKWTREIRRLFFSFSKQHQVCVRRRAAISVAANPACPNAAAAERAVNEVWESCFSDTRPFDEIY